MSSVSIRLPDWLWERVTELAAEDQVPVDQYVATALAEKLSALRTVEYLNDRARHGDRERFLAALNRAPDVEPPAEDRM